MAVGISSLLGNKRNSFSESQFGNFNSALSADQHHLKPVFRRCKHPDFYGRPCLFYLRTVDIDFVYKRFEGFMGRMDSPML